MTRYGRRRTPIDVDRELSRIRDEANELGRLYPSLRGQIAHELREEAKQIEAESEAQP